MLKAKPSLPAEPAVIKSVCERSVEDAKQMFEKCLLEIHGSPYEYWWLATNTVGLCELECLHRDNFELVRARLMDCLRDQRASISVAPHFDSASNESEEASA